MGFDYLTAGISTTLSGLWKSVLVKPGVVPTPGCDAESLWDSDVSRNECLIGCHQEFGNQEFVCPAGQLV
jgi:hypothetical protein